MVAIPWYSRPPGHLLVMLYLFGMVCVWALLCSLSHSAPDLDGMEELVWAASLEWGYTKHPPLPGWVIYFATQVFGRPVWLPFWLGMVFAAAGLWFVWRLGCELTSRHQAFMAVLLVSVTTYFSIRGTIFNHNTAQLWSIAASIWLFYRAQRDNRLPDWFFLGLIAGLALLTKYSAVIQLAAFFAYLLRSGKLIQWRYWPGYATALLVLLITISPHLLWLYEHSFEPLKYADSALHATSRLDGALQVLNFSVEQVWRLAPMLAVVGIWALWYRRKGDQAPGQAANDPIFAPGTAPASPSMWASLPPDTRQFLLWVGLTPFVGTVIVALLLGVRLDASWASTFFVLFGFFALWPIRGLETVQFRRIFLLVIVLQLLLATGYAIGRGPLANATGWTSRSNYPGVELAQRAQLHWQAHQAGRPLRVVVANTWLGGNIAIHTAPYTRVYINGRDAESPWFEPGTALRCGALVAYSRNGRAAPSAEVLALYEQAPWKGVDSSVQWGPNGPHIDLHWAVLPAGDDCRP